MLQTLAGVQSRFGELDRHLADPGLLADQARYREVLKERKRLEPIVEACVALRQVEADMEAARAMLGEGDAETRAWVQAELSRGEAEAAELEARLRVLLLPHDSRDERNVILEIRAGAGGEEAALFAADLARMYMRYAERRGWKTEVLDSNETGIGGFKELIMSIEGEGAFSRLKYESGVHRVQRVPETESSGRIHTSTATVAVLAEADEVEVDIKPDDLEIDTYRASGAGGQHVNKTESAIRITHKPSGIIVSCQDERSQGKNKARAMMILRARLLDLYQHEQANEIATERRSQVGSGERSERIRTYNFPQNRLSEERIDLTLYKLRLILDGELDEVIDALVAVDQSRLLQHAEEATAAGGRSGD
ncbi:MAG TPA: peptide chain release factor 1 [Bacillota bacterium]|nr:peptide chain release factor 1 [Bacillota bacterium]